LDKHKLYTPNIIPVTYSGKMRWVEHVACLEYKRDAYTFLVGSPEENILLGRPCCRW